MKGVRRAVWASFEEIKDTEVLSQPSGRKSCFSDLPVSSPPCVTPTPTAGARGYHLLSPTDRKLVAVEMHQACSQ